LASRLPTWGLLAYGLANRWHRDVSAMGPRHLHFQNLSDEKEVLRKIVA
jgi:hypothetical protein